MQIHVARPPAQLGVFSQEEVVAGLQAGRFLPTDQGWREGMSAWTPLSQWLEFGSLGMPPAPSEFAPAATAQPMPAWERGSSIGNYFGTIKDVALNPVQTFDSLPTAGGWGRALSFNYLAIGPVVLLGVLIFGLLLAVAGDEILADMRADQNLNAWTRNLSTGAYFALVAAISAGFALFAPLLNFVFSAATHVLLLPWGPKGGYAGCFRANSYVSGGFFLAGLIPFVGCIVLPWQVVVNVIALSRVHQLAWWKVAISVVLIPFVVCCGGLFVLVFDSMTGGGGP
jgi:hypothetical protein